MTAIVAGADGCRGGWYCVLRQADAPFREQAFVAKHIGVVLDHPSAPAVIAIDIPIGLPEVIMGAGRGCDIAARRILGPRGASVFAVPARAAFGAADYAGACAAARRASNPPRGISKQMFHLFPKIREVDGLMTPALQARVFECHPEAAFFVMNGRQILQEPKKRGGRVHGPGLDLRYALLMAQGFSAAFLSRAMSERRGAGADDFLDACACAWTAARIFRGEAIRFPGTPPLDAKGLRMEILA
jgi:predicted RNase H-like nuclease